MKTILNANEIKDCLKVLNKVKGIKSKTPDIFEHVLLYANQEKVQLIKSNLEETTIKVDLKYAHIEEPGQVVIPSDTVDLLKKLKDTEMNVTDTNIFADNKNISFIHIDEKEYIIPEDNNCEQVFSIPQKELKRMLEVKYAMVKDIDSPRPILYGVYFNNNEVCALDGFRMSIRKGNYENCSKNGFVVNAGTIKILDSLLSIKSDDEVKVYYDNSKAIAKFKFNNIEIIGKCIEGNFINYQRLIPEEYNHEAKINAKYLQDELKFSIGKDENTTKMTITDDNRMVLKSNQKNNTITSELKSENNINGEEFIIAYNTMYMIDAINTYKDRDIILKMDRNINPIIITNDDKNLELVLPVRLSDDYL